MNLESTYDATRDILRKLQVVIRIVILAQIDRNNLLE